MPFDSFLKSATGSFVGDLIGSTISYQRDKKSAKRQMDFQERMSSTAYQRAMNDMRKAGINPIMVSKLGGASTPTGASIPSKDLSKIGTNAVRNATTASQIQNLEANTRNTNEQAKVHSTTAELNSAKSLVEYQRAKTEQLIQQEKRANIEGKKIANTLALQTQQYFQKLGYPPQVLTARWQNIAGTYIWENLDERNKQKAIKLINDFATKSANNAQKFVDDPVGTFMNIAKGLF